MLPEAVRKEPLRLYVLMITPQGTAFVLRSREFARRGRSDIHQPHSCRKATEHSDSSPVFPDFA